MRTRPNCWVVLTWTVQYAHRSESKTVRKSKTKNKPRKHARRTYKLGRAEMPLAAEKMIYRPNARKHHDVIRHDDRLVEDRAHARTHVRTTQVHGSRGGAD